MEIISAPLFPLPNVVFFPKTSLPLHIYEPRYRQLMRDALSSDRRIAVGLLQPGWEQDYYGNPAVHEVCCVGTIDSFEELEDGKFDLVLVGEQKIRIVKVFKESPYRTIGGISLQEKGPARDAEETLQQQETILELARQYFKLRTSNEPELSGLHELRYEGLINSLASYLGFPASHKQQLLELDDLEQRGRLIAHFLRTQIHEQRVLVQFQHLTPKDPTWN